MSKQINKERLKKEIIELYERYLKNKEDEYVRKRADKIYSEYQGAGIILEGPLAKAIDLLQGITRWGKNLTEVSEMRKVPDEKIKQVIKELKKAK